VAFRPSNQHQPRHNQKYHLAVLALVELQMKDSRAPAPIDRLAMASLAQERDVRVGDYLDDKLQTLADLESLDSLLLNVRNQQSLLQRQLQDAQKDLDEARESSTDHASSVKARAQKFHEDQRDIDRRLQVVTQSDTSDDAVRRFETKMDKLRKLEMAKEYVQLLKSVDSLRYTFHDVTSSCRRDFLL
jgi:hypothetical protein